MTGWLPGDLVADQAHDLSNSQHVGNLPASWGTLYALCPHPILYRQHAARLIDGSGLAHIACVAAMPAPPRK